jgi:signal transduction histidine kinase
MKYTDKELLDLIIKYSVKIIEQKSIDDLLACIAEFAREIVHSDRCSIWLIDYEKHILWTKVAEGLEGKIKSLSIPIYSGVVGYSLLNKKDIILNDPYSSDIFYSDIDKLTGYKTNCLLAVPVKNTDDKIIGIAQVINKKDDMIQEFNQYDIECLKIALSYLSGALNILELQNKNREKDKVIFQQSKMADMGNMMAAIIHQWKQPLNVINLQNQKLDFMLNIDKISKEDILVSTDSINKQVKYINQTMNVFRDFFKPDQKKVLYNIEDVIEDVKVIIEKIYHSQGVNIFFNISYFELNGYPNELKHVLINILNNARDAIIHGGAKNKNIYVKSFSTENSFVMEIRDFAGGIPENIIDNIFDSYFTTKSDENGTGIGLDMVKEIVKKSNGTIEVENKVNKDGQKGACFTIYLPID